MENVCTKSLITGRPSEDTGHTVRECIRIVNTWIHL